jgi:hypothetical protein
MSETIPSGNIYIVPEEVSPDLPLKYYLHYEMELIHLALSRIGDQLEFNADVDRLVAVIEKEKANKYQAKTNKTGKKRREIYRAMCSLDKLYASEKLRKPKWADYADYLAGVKNIFGYNGKPYKERILREIKKLGDDGQL